MWKLHEKLSLFSAACHGGGGDSGGGGGSTNTTVQKSDPWSGQQPYLTDTFQKAQDLYNNYSPSYYDGNTVAPLSTQTNQYVGAAMDRAQGSQLEHSTANMLTNTTNGAYLGAGNPYLQNAMNTVAQSVVPQIDSKFEGSNRYGSGAHINAEASALSNAAGQMAYQNYADERGNQMKASLMTPQMNSMDWNNINQMNNAGSIVDNYNQSQINAAVQKHNWEQQLPYEKLNQYAAITNNGSYGSTNMGTSTQQMYRNPWASTAGGALLGGVAGNAIFGDTYGTVGGGLLGGMAGYYM